MRRVSLEFLLVITCLVITNTLSFQNGWNLRSLSKPLPASTNVLERRRIEERIQRIDTTPITSTSSTCLWGIPKMFRWLTDQYPDIVNRQLQDGLARDIKVDNFYLDMNGIIHPCTHGNAAEGGEFVVLDEAAMFKKIFLYVDRLYKLVQPTTVLYLAVDGVAPRAKMNQQRSRRFRSAKEAEVLAQEVLSRQQYYNSAQDTSISNTYSGADRRRDLSGTNKKQQQQNLDDLEKKLERRFDSNCITPGTDFMLKLNLALAKWVEFKMQTDPFWKNGADVVISGPDVPGEGEHKVMDYIRDTKEAYFDANNALHERSHWRPGLTHVLYGLDADLIMLGLVTHETNFMLLREKMSVVMAGRGRNKYRKKKDMMDYDKNDYELLELKSFRQLLSLQFRRFADDGLLEVDYELSRVIDDFVFMCMFVGNDFLPHCPNLEIDAGAISLMMTSYIDLLPEWKGYLTKREKIHPQRVEQFIYHLAAYEEEHFKKRGYEENEPGWKLSAENENDVHDFYGTYYTGEPTPEVAKPANRKNPTPPTFPSPSEEEEQAIINNVEKELVGNRKFRRQHPKSSARSYRDFYYETKLGWSYADRENTLFKRRQHVREYLEGLHWNLNYYHNGCKSWDWFFPYLYSPLATDMVNLNEFYNDEDSYEDADEEGFRAFRFDLGTPFPSLAQLLSVLPPQSASLLPKPLGELMVEPASPLLEYYPPDFVTDANGKRQSWEAIVQIPFIDSDILLSTVQQVMDADQKNPEQPLLTNAERLRNVRGKDHYFVPNRDSNHPKNNNDTTNMEVSINDSGTEKARSGTFKAKGTKKGATATATATATAPKTRKKRTTKKEATGTKTKTKKKTKVPKGSVGS